MRRRSIDASTIGDQTAKVVLRLVAGEKPKVPASDRWDDVREKLGPEIVARIIEVLPPPPKPAEQKHEPDPIKVKPVAAEDEVIQVMERRVILKAPEDQVIRVEEKRVIGLPKEKARAKKRPVPSE